MHDSGMLWALRFEDGRAFEAAAPMLGAPATEPGEWGWSHFPLGDVRARAWILRIPDLPEAARELIETHDDRVRFGAGDGWTFGVLPDLERDLAGDPVGPGRLFFLLGPGRLVTARLHALKVIDDVHRQAQHGERIATPEDAVVALVEHYADLLDDRFEQLGRRLDAVEDRVLGAPADLDGLKLGPFRREVARHRRELQSLRGALGRSRHVRQPGIPSPLIEALGPLLAPVEDLDHDAASLQDRARLLHEEIDTLINSATNRSMRTLTVISTLLIPPTLVVGAFGMNVEGIPFARSPAGFAVASFICLGLVAGAFTLLRRLRLLP